MTINDPEYLNDGEHADTPLNIALDGRSTYVGKPRNLKIARLLVERGADANFRVPDNDLGFGQSESPIERLVTYYLDLLKVFKSNVLSGDASSGENGTINHHMDDFSELLDTVGLNGEAGLTSEGLIQQTRFLLDIFFAKTRIKRYLYSGPWFLLNSATKATGKCDSQDFCKNNC